MNSGSKSCNHSSYDFLPISEDSVSSLPFNANLFTCPSLNNSLLFLYTLLHLKPSQNLSFVLIKTKIFLPDVPLVSQASLKNSLYVMSRFLPFLPPPMPNLLVCVLSDLALQCSASFNHSPTRNSHHGFSSPVLPLLYSSRTLFDSSYISG